MIKSARKRWVIGTICLGVIQWGTLRDALAEDMPSYKVPPASVFVSQPTSDKDLQEFVGPVKPEVTKLEYEAKLPTYSERLKAQNLERTILLATPNPRGQILAERFDEQGRKYYSVLANSKNGRYFQIDFSSIMRETDPAKIYEYVKTRVEWINTHLGKQETVSEYDALTYFEYRRWIPLRVGSMLSRKEIAALANQSLPEGLSYLDMPVRNYPHGALAGHVLGAVKRSKGWPLREFAEGDERFPPIDGIKGLEKSQNAVLQGIPTVYKYEFDKDGQLKSKPSVVSQGRLGLNIVLSMDIEMQKIAEDLLRQHTAKSGTGKGAMVVIDINTMEIKALASWPLIDPNDFVPVLTAEVQAKWKAEGEANNDHTISRAFQAAYPPASTFKIATGLMALTSNAVQPNEARYRCMDSMTYGQNTMKNWTQEVDQPWMRVTDALKRSCNTWFFQAANEMQEHDQLFGKWFHYLVPMLGFGSKTNLELSEEIPGYAYVKDGQAQPFFEGANVANVSIGQGDLAVTPLQLAQMVARVANPIPNSKAFLIKNRQTDEGELTSLGHPIDEQMDLLQYERQLSWIRTGMWDVVYGDFGTGPLAKPRLFSVAGKTGTAQWSKNRNVAWFASYAPFYDGSANYPAPPKYAVVMMQEGNSGQTLSGGNHAAPAVGEFFNHPYVENLVMSHIERSGGRSIRSVPFMDR